jgi:mannose-6-phosphate isomerase-like protein (cupin superfamily)
MHHIAMSISIQNRDLCGVLKMKFEIKNARKFSWKGIEGYAYNSKDDFANMCGAFIIVTGRHGKIKNMKSDRIYFVIEGSGKFIVNDKVIEVKKTDIVLIPKNTPYDFEGEMKLFLVTSPSFDPKDEIKLEGEK